MKKSVKDGTGKSGGRRIGSFLAAFALGIVLISETIVVVSYVVPTLAILLFQYAQISIDRSVTLANFSMADAIVIGMMWCAPVLVMCGLVTRLQWTVTKRLCRVIWKLVLVSIGRGEEKGDEGE